MLVARAVSVGSTNQVRRYSPRVEYGRWHLIEDVQNMTSRIVTAKCGQALESPLESSEAYPKLSKKCTRCLK